MYAMNTLLLRHNVIHSTDFDVDDGIKAIANQLDCNLTTAFSSSTSVYTLIPYYYYLTISNLILLQFAIG